jgi:predicted protein tyrosine phosphatase
MSRGYMGDPPALIHPMILIGAGAMLTPEFIAKHNISHVINCAENEMCPSWIPLAFVGKYVFLEAVDSHDVNIIQWYPKFKATMQRFLRDPECSRVFVHCQCGINRSAFLAITYVCDVFKFQYFDARDSVKQQRPCALSNLTFSNQVFEFLKSIR